MKYSNRPNPKGYEQSSISRRDARLQDSLNRISHCRRRSILNRPLSEYSNNELKSALKLDPTNELITTELNQRLNPISEEDELESRLSHYLNKPD